MCVAAPFHDLFPASLATEERAMWRNDRDRPDDQRTPVRETQRPARDEYDRPRYGSPPADQIRVTNS